MSIYDHHNYPQGVPNPLGPRVHAWTGGPMDEGTRYHGAIWTRPQSEPMAWNPTPRWQPFVPGYESLTGMSGGCGCRGAGQADGEGSTSIPIWKVAVAVGLAAAVVWGAVKFSGLKKGQVV